MANYLSSNADQFKKCLKSKIFVDESLIIKECNDVLWPMDSFIWLVRPRRAGKTVTMSGSSG